MSGKLSFVNFLRIWLGLVGIVAFGNTVQCFVPSTYLYDRLYSVNEANVTALTSRLFGVWTLLSGAVRFLCALDIHNKPLYILTLITFLLASGHFLSEVGIYGTAMLQSAGIIAPLIVANASILAMLIGFIYIGEEDPRAKFGDENEQLVPRAKKLKRKDL